ncbi:MULTISPECIES: hypothetical protein [Nocardia]|uniref:Uncharacterized protein n=1 Tax=Nocardia aurea TaxID=2144174 RepID=A0ABV3FZC1_9NOCA|nr:MULTISPECIES: hypothetical protein [Nocardia]
MAVTLVVGFVLCALSIRTSQVAAGDGGAGRRARKLATDRVRNGGRASWRAMMDE